MLGSGITLRALVSFALFWLAGCGASSPAPHPEQFRASDAAASYAAYQEYCGLCPKAETCCLAEADFAANRWSPLAGPYLRAMRDYYQCQRSATLYQSVYAEPPSEPPSPSAFGELTNAGHDRLSCFPHACADFAELMVSQLDRAQAKPEAHVPGALVICSADAAVASAP